MALLQHIKRLQNKPLRQANHRKEKGIFSTLLLRSWRESDYIYNSNHQTLEQIKLTKQIKC